MTDQQEVDIGTTPVCKFRLLGQSAFGYCAIDLRLIRYTYFGTYATLGTTDHARGA